MPLLYLPNPSKCVVPVGLDPTAVHPGFTTSVVGQACVVGVAVGFVCLTPELLVSNLAIGGKLLRFSKQAFPSEAAGGDGILLPVEPVEAYNQMTASFHNRTGHVVFPTAFFLVEIDREGAGGAPKEGD